MKRHHTAQDQVSDDESLRCSNFLWNDSSQKIENESDILESLWNCLKNISSQLDQSHNIEKAVKRYIEYQQNKIKNLEQKIEESEKRNIGLH